MISDEAMTQALREDFTSNREAMVEKAVQENREAVKSLEASMPPDEETPKIKFDFKDVPNSAVQVLKMPKSHQWLKSQQKKTKLFLRGWFLTLRRKQLVQDVTLLILK